MTTILAPTGIDLRAGLNPGDSLAHQAMEAVKAFIRQNQLRVGDELPGEAYFANALDVSRAVIREAFGALSALRLIEVANGRKARVGALDGSVIAASLGHGVATAQIKVPEIWDVRRTIEVRTAALAAAHRTSDQAHDIVAFAEAMANDGDDLASRVCHDIAFHETIARASHNALFVQIVSAFGPLMQIAVPAAWRTRTTPEERQATIDHHNAVASAIAQGDPDAAIAAMARHFDTSIDTMIKAYP